MMRTAEEFYGEWLPALKQTERQLLDLIGAYPASKGRDTQFGGIQYLCSRIKAPDSMVQKLRSRGEPATAEAALTKVYDAVGIRVICPFIDDVYQVADWLERRPELSIVKKKDYIACPKPNGYRGYHLIVKLLTGDGAGMTAEIQIRTIALDCWASLEHIMKYKKQVRKEELIRSELKRCADELASVDLSMQTIRDWLNAEEGDR